MNRITKTEYWIYRSWIHRMARNNYKCFDIKPDEKKCLLTEKDVCGSKQEMKKIILAAIVDYEPNGVVV
jgi:hypothetical protein